MPWLFSYGTLRDPVVQRAVFGRLLEGEIDSLPGFRLGTVAIADPDVVATSGMVTHLILHRDAAAVDPIAGAALQIEEADLSAADQYEGGNYARETVVLASGRLAFVYVNPSDK